MTSTRVTDHIAAMYRDLVPAGLRAAVPSETIATCATCVMTKQPGETPDPVRYYFRPDVKCCTYHPRLANFLVGGILSDPATAAGAERIGAKIAARDGVFPEGIVRPPAETARLEPLVRAGDPDYAFGRSAALRCPYLDKATVTCTIYAYREATCGTYFCRSSSGLPGKAMWTAVGNFLSSLDAVLAKEIADRLLGRNRTPADFGAWTGREAAFYRQAYDHARGFTADEVATLIGAPGAAALAEVTARIAEVQRPSLPERLKLNERLVTRRRLDGGLQIKTNALSTWEISRALAMALHEIDAGGNWRRVVGELRVRGVELDESLVVRLYQESILVAAELEPPDDPANFSPEQA